MREDEFDSSKNEYIIPFVIKNDRIERCCILWIVPFEYASDFNTNKISYILRHECGHAFDMLVQRKTNSELNRDTILLNVIDVPSYTKDISYLCSDIDVIKKSQQKIKNITAD